MTDITRLEKGFKLLATTSHFPTDKMLFSSFPIRSKAASRSNYSPKIYFRLVIPPCVSGYLHAFHVKLSERYISFGLYGKILKPLVHLQLQQHTSKNLEASHPVRLATGNQSLLRHGKYRLPVHPGPLLHHSFVQIPIGNYLPIRALSISFGFQNRLPLLFFHEECRMVVSSEVSMNDVIFLSWLLVVTWTCDFAVG